MQRARGLDRWNECDQIIFYPVWTDAECRKSHDTNTCHDRTERGGD